VARLVAGHECRCAVAVRHAFARAERSLRRRIARAEAPDGSALGIDRTRGTLARRADGLRPKVGGLLARSVALGNRIVDGADLVVARRTAEALLAGLQEIETAERHLVLESVNTDLGVGA